MGKPRHREVSLLAQDPKRERDMIQIRPQFYGLGVVCPQRSHPAVPAPSHGWWPRPNKKEKAEQQHACVSLPSDCRCSVTSCTTASPLHCGGLHALSANATPPSSRCLCEVQPVTRTVRVGLSTSISGLDTPSSVCPDVCLLSHSRSRPTDSQWKPSHCRLPDHLLHQG